MEITEVKVFPINEEKLKAFVSVVFDGCFMVNDIKIIRGRDGLFISMPSRRKKNGEFKDVAHPLNNDTRKRIEARILGEYERVLEERASKGGGARQPAPSPEAPRKEPRQPPAQPQAAAAEPAASTPEATPEPLSPVPPVTAAPAQPAPAPQAASAPAEAGESTKPDDDGETDSTKKSLQEVEEAHLEDSFWTVK